MTGTTPAMLTLIGMYVFVPPYVRRPTMRLAYCTGMRRCDCSTNTTSADHDDADREHEEEDLEALATARSPTSSAGKAAAIEVKIRMRHAVADAALGDELGEPHDEAGAGGHRDDHEQLRPPHVVGEQLLALGDAGRAEQLHRCGRPSRASSTAAARARS